MKTDMVKVSYRDENKQTVVLYGKGATDPANEEGYPVQQPETVDEAITLYGSVESLLDLAHTANVIDKQREVRDSGNPNKPKSATRTPEVKAFSQLSEEKQRELLRNAGLLQ